MKVNSILSIMFLVFLVTAAGMPQSKMKTDGAKNNVNTKTVMHKKTMKNKNMHKPDIMMKNSGGMKKGKMMHCEKKDAGEMKKKRAEKTKPAGGNMMKSKTKTESMHKSSDTYMKKMKEKNKN